MNKYQQKLLEWYKQEGRILPWRETRDPYKILVSEVMLQQTQVDRVIPKYFEFLEAFPDVTSLAKATKGDVLRLWSGLGYNSRALRLKHVAEQALLLYDGKIPSDEAALLSLKGIGPYTAGAIQAFAFEKSVSFIDTNIKRILHRVFVGHELQGWKKKDKEIQELAAKVYLKKDAYSYHQALMDLGATICKASKLLCEECPLSEVCATKKQLEKNPQILQEKRKSYKKSTVPFKQSKRYIRGGVVEYLRNFEDEHRGASFEELYHLANEELREMEREELQEILGDLVTEGVVTKDGGKYRL